MANKHTPWNVERAHALIAEQCGREGPLLPLLHAFQEEFGFIDEAAYAWPSLRVSRLWRSRVTTASSCFPTRTGSWGERALMSYDKSADKLVYMANQIGMFFRGQSDAAAISGTAEHLKKFWDPRMRAAILEHLDAGGEGLDPWTRQAVELLRAPGSSS